ncbi:MAG: hypothetical protein MJZ20_14210 [Bacteroidaceae bacterium]|nr:hypothetical protein [Bacteroidaceae bacterium]
MPKVPQLSASEIARIDYRRSIIKKKFKELRIPQNKLAVNATEKTKYSFFETTISSFFNGTLPATTRTVELCDVAEEMIREEEKKLSEIPKISE